jgi:hypothetical protein
MTENIRLRYHNELHAHLLERKLRLIIMERERLRQFRARTVNQCLIFDNLLVCWEDHFCICELQSVGIASVSFIYLESHTTYSKRVMYVKYMLHFYLNILLKTFLLRCIFNELPLRCKKKRMWVLEQSVYYLSPILTQTAMSGQIL